MSNRQDDIQNERTPLPSPSTRHQDHEEGQSDAINGDDPRRMFEDDFELQLRAQSGQDSQVRAFLHDYSHFKDCSVKQLFQPILDYTVSQPPSTFQSIASTEGLDERTFSNALNDLRAALRKDNPGCVRTCVLSLDYYDAARSKVFPLRARLFATVEQLKRRFRAPVFAFLLVIRQEWKHLENAKMDYNVTSNKKYGRPSAKRPSEFSLEMPLTLNSSKETSLELEWMASAPEYWGSFSTYIWQPHTETPKSKGARFYLSKVVERGRDVLVLLDSWDLAKGSLEKYRLDRSELGSFRTSDTSSSTATEIHLLIYAAFKSLIEDTTSFIDGSLDQLAELKYTGRQSPSSGKLHFLLHLDDCCHLASSGLAHAYLLLNEIHQSATSCVPEIDQGLREWPCKALEDIKFFQNQLEVVQGEALIVRDMIKDQLDIRNGRRTSLVGLLAAIYIPFAWTSSLFGMNISGPVWGPLIPDATSNSNPTNSTASVNDSLSLSENQTDAIVGAISSSGSYLWSFKMYWAVTAPVTLATILLPLIAGHIFRSITQFGYENRTYALTISALLILTGIIVMSIYITPIAYLLIFGITFGVIALIAIVYASWTGRYQWLWAGFSMVFAASFAIDREVITVFPTTGVLPLFYLVLVYFRHDIKHFLEPCIERYRPYMTKALDGLHHLWTLQVVIVWMYYTLAIICSSLFPTASFFVLCIPLGVLGINRSISIFAKRKAEHKRYWTIYSVIYLASLMCGWFVSGLILALVPMTYLFTLWLYLNNRRWIDSQLWRLRRGSRGGRNGSAA